MKNMVVAIMSKMSYIDHGEVISTIEGLLKDNHCLILADLDFLSCVEYDLYMNNNNEDFKLITGGFSEYGRIASIAIVKKTKELREYFGIDQNDRWKYLLCVCQDKVEGHHLLRLDGVYEVPKWGKTKSIRMMLNSIFTTFEITEEAEKQGVKFSWRNLPLLYCFEEDYQEYWFDKGRNGKPKRKRTNIPRGIRHEVFKRDNYTCVECGAKKEDGATLHVDHIIPISKGGTDELSNLQTLCSECNLNKSDVIQGGFK